LESEIAGADLFQSGCGANLFAADDQENRVDIGWTIEGAEVRGYSNWF
jgi:hypothetical protein